MITVEKINELLNENYIYNNVKYCLVSKNCKWLENAPYKEYLDLALAYTVPLEDEDIIKINNNFANHFNLDIKKLDEMAKENSSDYIINTMSDVLQELAGVDSLSAGNGFYVATNYSKYYGASIMAFPKYFESLSLLFKDDLYILPSSVHEVLVLPASEIDVESLRQMVKSVNQEILTENEFLSNSVYHYSEGEIKIA